MLTRRLVVAVAAAASLLALFPVAPASATSLPINATIAPAWGKGAIKIVRAGWTVRITGTLTDTRADGDCVYVEAVLQVDDYTDPDTRTPNHCGGKGTSRSINLSMTPGKGSRLASVRVRVCAADAAKDSCLERTYTVPNERAVQPARKADVDRYMSMSMANFQAANRKAPKPFDWSDDGCSNSPDKPDGFNFLPACQRHDFGYRNYGKGAVKAAPFDNVRASVDARLRTDLLNECAKHSGSRRTKCQGLAQTFYGVVRKAGGRSFYVS